MKRRIVSVLTVLALFLGLCPFSAFAAGASTFDLDLHDKTNDETSNWDSQHYKWENVTTEAGTSNITSGTLTLAENFNARKVTLPGNGAEVTIDIQGNSTITTLDYLENFTSTSIQLTFTGTKDNTLTISNHINFSGGNDSIITVAENAVVVANNGINVDQGAGVDGTVIVNGTLTVGHEGYNGQAVYTGKVAVGDKGVLEIFGDYGVFLGGMGSASGDFDNLFTITGGGRFTSHCTDYHVKVAASGSSFPEGTTAGKAIPLTGEYLPKDCEVKSTTDTEINLVEKGTTNVYTTTPMSIHKAHTYEKGIWIPFEEDYHRKKCDFDGCYETDPDTQAKHTYVFDADSGEYKCSVCKYQHTHDWATDWKSNNTHHWHECASGECPVTENSKKNGYEEHGYHNNENKCYICGYDTQIVSPPGDNNNDNGNGGTTSGGGGGSSSSYTIKIEKPEHGEVTSDRRYTDQGELVRLTVKPDSGYRLTGLTVTDGRGNEIAVTEEADGTFTFTMPNSSVTVRASFGPDGQSGCGGGIDCPSRAYRDLDTSQWYHLAVDYVLRNGLMSGYGNQTFGPNDPLTRAQFAQILYNQAGRPAVTGSSPFTDVDPGEWFAPAVSWAAERGVVNGYGNGLFGPNDPITREQLAAMLWRYSDCPEPTISQLDFTDAAKISPYALAPLRWAVELHVVNGLGNRVLDPQGLASRAQIAQMLLNLFGG